MTSNDDMFRQLVWLSQDEEIQRNFHKNPGYEPKRQIWVAMILRHTQLESSTFFCWNLMQHMQVESEKDGSF